MKKNKNKKVILFFLTAASCIAALAIAELIFRTVAPEYIEFQNSFIPSETTIITLKSNIQRSLIHPANHEPPFYISTNSMGLRSNQEITFSLPENTKRIVCLGDSYTFGFGVEDNETYPFYLQERLNEGTHGAGWRYQVINAGFASGVATDAQYLYLKKKGVKFSPEIVTLGFCIANDFIDMSKNKWVHGKDGKLEKIFNPESRKIPDFIKRTAIYVALKTLLLEKRIEPKNVEPINVGMMERAKFLFKEIKALGNEKGFKFILIMIPPIKLLNNNSADGYDERIKELTFFCQQNEIPYIDLSTELNTSHIFPGKVHFNKKGNIKVADNIARHVRNQNIISAY